MIGIVMAGGAAKRMYPTTKGVSKHLLPIYDKPLIYYPISTLMLCGVREIIIVANPDDIPSFNRILGDGNKFGIRIKYVEQNRACGVAEGLALCREYILGKSVIFILGDNIFCGENLSSRLQQAIKLNSGSTIFCYPVNDVSRFGVVELDNYGKPSNIIEKPETNNPGLAITGLYIFDNQVLDMYDRILPSERGELEISDVIQQYLKANRLKMDVLGRGFAWIDAGTCESYLDAAVFIKTLEQIQGFKIACLEEIGLRKNWISIEELRKSYDQSIKSPYAEYVIRLLTLQ